MACRSSSKTVVLIPPEVSGSSINGNSICTLYILEIQDKVSEYKFVRSFLVHRIDKHFQN